MKNLITWFLNEVMQREALEQAGADKYERTGTRRTYRNGNKIPITEIAIWTINSG
jgi:putative transposase